MSGFPHLPSLALAPTADAARPSNLFRQGLWLAPLLHIMGQHTGYKPYVTVDADDAFKFEVLRAGGLNPDDPASLPLPLKGKKGLLYIQYTTHYFQQGCISVPPRHPLTMKDKKGRWGLTEQGVVVALKLRSAFIAEASNITAAWLEGQFDVGLLARMHEALLMEPSLSKDRASGEIMTHVQHFFAVSIKRDAFRSRLESGDPPTFRQMRDWALRKAHTRFRSRAQDPIHRMLRGARTKKERETGNINPKAMIKSSFENVIQESQDRDTGEALFQTVLVDTEATDRTLHRMAWEQGMDKVRDAIRRHKPGNPERYVRVFGLMASGLTVEELAAEENVSRNRAASIMADTRTALRSARKAAVDARVVVKYIEDNPCSTVADLEEDLILETGIAWLVKHLVENARLNAQPFIMRSGKPILTYTVTNRGLAFLADKASQGDIIGSLSL